MGKRGQLESRAGGEPSRTVPEQARICKVCGVKLSAYNQNPTCWRHTIGHPWRGPTAKPKF